MKDERSERGSAGSAPVEHTADIGLRVWGPSLEELFEQAADGMVSLLVDQERIRSIERREIALEAADLEEALVTFLQEILYIYEVGRFIPAAISVLSAGSSGVRFQIEGEPFDAKRHRPRADIKAATYHNLTIRETRGPDGSVRLETVIIFDI